MNNFLHIIQQVCSWHDIHEALAKFNTTGDTSAGNLFEEFCKYYFLTEPTVKNDYKNVWQFNEIPLSIKIKLGLGKIDHGVDLVLEGHDSSLSVVQCKFKNNQDSKISWTKDRLANLFAEGDKADYFIVFTNGSGLDKHSITKKENRLTIITSGDLINISTETINQIKSICAGLPLKPIAMKEPRDYQEEAIRNVIEGFNQSDRGQLILPCGAGKTLVSLWIMEALNAKHTLILVPSLALLKQIKDEWSANSSYIPRICVCSEKDIDKGKDNTVSHTYEIGGNVSTDADEIRQFLNSHEKSIVYSTYQSLIKICDAIKGSGFQFDLAICDEAHKTSGSKLSYYGLIHSDINVSIKKRLYMTATPRILSTTLRSELKEDMVDYICDMSNPAIFGNEFHRMSFKEAIDRNILVDYQIVAIGVTDFEIKHALNERKYISDNETIDEIANNYALDKFMKEHGSTHAITFHSSVKKAKEFQERHEKNYNDTSTFHVNGAQSTNQRKILMDEFVRSSKSVMTNARCLTEGVDVPAIDAVYFCDPKNSKVDIVQATGRALRRADHKGKKFGYVIVPIFHHSNENVEETINLSAFKNLMSIIRAISSHDERLTDEITKIKLGKGRRRPISNRISISGQLDLITLEGFEEDLQKALFSQIINKSPIPFRKFTDAREFARSLNFKSSFEWVSYCKSGKKPDNVPFSPNQTYKHKGWISYGDWLGTGNISHSNKVFRTFELAREFAHSLNLQSYVDWSEYIKSGKKPDDIPSSPHSAYKDKGWISWGDWLDTGNLAPTQKTFRPFEAARNFVHSLGLKNQNEWSAYTKTNKKPDDIPFVPNSTYAGNGWISWGDWLGTGKVSNEHRVFRSFESAREFARSLNLKKQTEWFKYTKDGNQPYDIPAYAASTYADEGWISWGDWLGIEFLSFETAREFARLLNLKSKAEWSHYTKSGEKPDNIPSNPYGVYKNKGWISWGDWLDTGNVAPTQKTFRSFEAAREFVHSLNLINSDEWITYCKSGHKPVDIPSVPERTYKDKGFTSYGNWLGTGRIASFNMVFRSYELAVEFARSLNLKSKTEWNTYCKSSHKPDDIPSAPEGTYKNKGWVSWSHWLGKSE